MAEACKTALRTIARGCLAELRRHGRAAAEGDTRALHRARIALTRLRTAIRFFAPAVDGEAWTRLQRQAAGLSREAGAARDFDVALACERGNREPARTLRQWREQRDRQRARLARTLRSVRYTRFIDALSRQVGAGTSLRDGQLQPNRFATQRLNRWRGRLLRKGRKLDRLGTNKLHRLRIRAKRFRYALEWSLPFLQQQQPLLRQQIAAAKRIQNALGRLNDAATHAAHARTLRLDPLPSVMRLGRRKSQRRLLKAASGGFHELRQLAPV